MGFGRIITSAVAASICTVGLAGPASASDDISQNALGTYKVDFSFGSYLWTVLPCADDAPECVLITQYGPKDTTLKHPNWSANAYWTVGSWVVPPVDTPFALKCKDGVYHNLPVGYSWNADINTGNKSFFDPGICDGKAVSHSNPFTVTKIGPPPGTD